MPAPSEEDERTTVIVAETHKVENPTIYEEQGGEDVPHASASPKKDGVSVHALEGGEEGEASDEDEAKDVVMIEPERMNSSPERKTKGLTEDEWEMVSKETLML